MSNSSVTAFAAIILYGLDHLSVSPWFAAPVALAAGFSVAWLWTRRPNNER